MSTILKALRRLEEEQGARGEIPLREAVTASPQRSRDSSRWRWFAGSAALCGLAVAGWLVLGGDAEPDPLSVAGSSVAAVPVAGTAAAPAPSVPVAGTAAAPAPSVPVAGTAAVPAPSVPVAGTAAVPAPSVPVAGTAVVPAPSVPVAGTAVVPAPSVPVAGTAVVPAPSVPNPVESPGLPAAAYASRVERVNRPLPAPRLGEADSITPAARTAGSQNLAGTPRPQRSGAAVDESSKGARVAPTPVHAGNAEPDPWEQAAAASPAALSEGSSLPLSEVASTTPVVKVAAPEPVAKSPAPAPVAKPPKAPAPVAKSPAPAPVAKPPKAPAKPVAKVASVAKALLPELQVAQTQWHPSAARRTALLTLGSGEQQAVHEGDEIGRFVVSRIEPSAVVFLAGDDEVRRRVGEN